MLFHRYLRYLLCLAELAEGNWPICRTMERRTQDEMNRKRGQCVWSCTGTLRACAYVVWRPERPLLR